MIDLLLLNSNNINVSLFAITALLTSLLVDLIFGELPAKVHPVVIIGSFISYFKNIYIKIRNRTSGFLLILSVCLLSGVITYLIYIISTVNIVVMFLVYVMLLTSTFSVKMLLQTAIDVEKALNENIDTARQLVSYLVSRNTDELTESFIVSATIESLTENITDSYVAPVFYYMIFASVMSFYHFSDQLFYLLLIPIFYRIFNTMDAMVGYKSDELIHIGFLPAKIDDILNYIPSRIAGLFVVVSAYLLKYDGKNAFKIMMRDARKCPSPNSGYTMATTAGALNIRLIKKDTYILGDDNKDIITDDISRAVKLSELTMLLFTITIILLFASTVIL